MSSDNVIEALLRPTPLKGAWRRFWPHHRLLTLGFALALPLAVRAQDDKHFGFAFDESDLTLEPGRRTEAAGPFFYSQEKEGQKLWAVPPFFSYNHDFG